jgi:hypothetical protein
MAERWKLLQDADRLKRREIVFDEIMACQSIRRVSRNLRVNSQFILDVLKDYAREQIALEEERRRPAPYVKITVRQTENQHELVFGKGNCPLQVSELRFSLALDGASELFGWLNDELEEEQHQGRRKAIENLLGKMRAEERRERCRPLTSGHTSGDMMRTTEGH